MQPKDLSIADFTYHLPTEAIALHPLENRDASKLLLYRQGGFTETVFSQLPHHLPANSHLYFNDTKVIKARLSFYKNTGSVIEIFCLEPADTITDYSVSLLQTETCRWQCFIGGASKWKEQYLHKEIYIGDTLIKITAEKKEVFKDAYIVQFSWTPTHFSFAEILEAAGNIPLPPYIKRQVEADDLQRYQTIFAKQEGSVAAPTAGLHFTAAVLDALKQKQIGLSRVTLHVGAGTFKPVKSLQMKDHIMHAEYMDVSIQTLEELRHEAFNIAVGTTSLRTLESLYWMGVKIILQPQSQTPGLAQWEVYEEPLASATYSLAEAMEALITWLKKQDKTHLFTQTQIIIAPGYKFKVVNGFITNFHQPQSTLLLLVAAAVGNHWRNLYDYALKHQFRFLSYGDANLILLDNEKT